VRVASGTFFGKTIRKLDLNGFVIAEAAYAPHLRIERHLHEKSYLSFVLAGGYLERYRNGSRTCRSGTVLYHPIGEAHADVFPGCGARLVSLEIPERHSRCAREIGPRDPLRQVQLGQLMENLHNELETSCVLSLESILFEIAAALTRGADPRTKEPRWYRIAIEVLHDRFAEPLSLTELATEVGIHPVSLARGFHRQHGCTIGEFVRTLRVNFAREELMRTVVPIADVAQRAGFADQSHLCRVFKQRTGMTPSEFRASLS
jgi:AraC family transcriptional regulator